MSRFYVPKESIKNNIISISGKEAHHILDVMRLKVSDEAVVFDGTGREYVAKVKETGRRLLSLEIIKTRDAASTEKFSITLIQAIPKKDKMDHIVQKATELGVKNIVPVTTMRTIPDWNEPKKTSIAGRWQKISQEAAKQCGRVDLPKIWPITDLAAAIDPTAPVWTSVPTGPVGNLKLIAALSDKAVKLKDALKSFPGGMITIAIGPEGDFTPEEVASAEKKGFKTVNLGPRVLKSDTAALAVLAMINYEYSS